MTPKLILAVDVELHGVDNSSYFQGAGVSFTRYDDIYIGIGDSEREALENALEDLASTGEYRFLDKGAPTYTEDLASGGEPEPDPLDYSDVDEVQAILDDHAPTVPDPEYQFRLYPYNGSGPIERSPVFDDRESALAYLPTIQAQFEDQTFECLGLSNGDGPETIGEWETQIPEHGVGDTEGILRLECLNEEEIAKAESEIESYGEDRELYYYVSVRVSDKAE